MHETNHSQKSYRPKGNGFYKLFTISKQKQIDVQTFNDYNDSYAAFNKSAVSRILTCGFDVRLTKGI